MAWYPGKNIERLMQKRREKDAPSPRPEAGKEDYYLRFNKDEIFKNLIASEGHFRNVVATKENIEAGFLNCVVKHLADAESHADEAISHSAIVEGDEQSEKFCGLRDDIQGFRHTLQDEGVNALEGVKHVRRLRRTFESFNKEYDVSRCKACEPIEVLMEKALQQQKKCEES